MIFKIILRLYFLFLLFTVSFCSGNYEKLINRGIDQFKQENYSAATQLMEEGIIKNAKTKSYSAPYPESTGSLLYKRSENELSIVFPGDISLNIQNFDAIAFCNKTRRTALSRGDMLSIYNPDGSLLKSLSIDRSKEKIIRAITWIEDDLIYYLDGKIFIYSVQDNKNDPFITNEVFAPPFTGSYYRAAFSYSSGYVLITAGIAGQYNMSLLDTKNRSIIFKNKTAASSKILLNNNRIYYINGTSGSWVLTLLSINPAAKKDLIGFNNLIDIEMYASGAILENNDGLWIYDYAGKPVALPFSYKLHGRCGEYGLIEYDSDLYITDMRKFFDRINILQKEIPGFFKSRR